MNIPGLSTFIEKAQTIRIFQKGKKGDKNWRDSDLPILNQLADGHEPPTKQDLMDFASSRATQTIKQQEGIIITQEEHIERLEKARTRLILLTWWVGLAVWTIIWNVPWQIWPKSPLSEGSSALAKLVSDTPTALELILEGEHNLIVIEDLKNNLSKTKQLNIKLEQSLKEKEELNKSYVDDLIETKGYLIQLLIDQEKRSHERKWKKVAVKSEPLSTTEGKNCRDEKYFTTPYNSRIYNKVLKLKEDTDIENILSENNAEMKITKACKWIHVSIKQNWKTSLGFYANTQAWKARTEKEGMMQWVQYSLEQLALVEQIESTLRNKGIPNSSISLKIEKKYNTWNVQVILSGAVLDTKNNKEIREVAQFTILKGDNIQIIDQKADKALGIFFPSI